MNASAQRFFSDLAITGGFASTAASRRIGRPSLNESLGAQPHPILLRRMAAPAPASFAFILPRKSHIAYGSAFSRALLRSSQRETKMFRDLVSKLSGGQITTIILALILVPGAVGAAVTFQPIAIVDPTSGRPSYIDPGRKLYVHDPIAGYRNNPANVVHVSMRHFGTTCDGSYTIPAGKALIITSISGYEQQYNNMLRSGVTLIDGARCSGLVLADHMSSVSVAAPAAPVAMKFGAGILVRPGRTVSFTSYYNIGTTYMHGYLVPAAAVAATASAQEREGPSPVTTSDLGPQPQ
jgi:hypothetical protein